MLIYASRTFESSSSDWFSINFLRTAYLVYTALYTALLFRTSSTLKAQTMNKGSVRRARSICDARQTSIWSTESRDGAMFGPKEAIRGAQMEWLDWECECNVVACIQWSSSKISFFVYASLLKCANNGNMQALLLTSLSSWTPAQDQTYFPTSLGPLIPPPANQQYPFDWGSWAKHADIWLCRLQSLVALLIE